MKKIRYKIKLYDPANDIWLLQTHLFWFFWSTIASGTLKELTGFIANYNKRLDLASNDIKEK